MRSGDVQDAIVFNGMSVLGAWVSEVVWTACARSEPPIEVYPVGSGFVVEDLGRSEGSRRVFLVNLPTRPFMDAVVAGQLPVLAVLDDPVDSVRFTKIVLACDILQALRVQTGAASAHHLLHQNSAVVHLARGSTGSAREMIASIIAHLGITLPPSQIEAVAETYGGPPAESWPLEVALRNKGHGYMRLDGLGEAVTAEEAGLVRQVLSPMVLGAISTDIGPITWISRVFLSGDRPNEVAPPVADVTGAARILYYGPYFHLPPGTWKVRIVVGFSPAAAGTPFKLFVYCDHRAIAKIQVTPREGGAFEGTFTMQHLQPEHSIEIQFSNDEGSIEGHTALAQVEFTRLAG